MRVPASAARVAMVAVTAAVLAMSAVAHSGSLVRDRIYRPDPMPARPEWRGVPVPEAVEVRTDDGLVLTGYRWAAAQADHVTLVFFHGNGGNRYTAAQLAAPLHRAGAEIIVASYRGYGGNPGRPDEQGLYRDAEAFLRLARQSHPRRLYLFGYSLGGAVALRTAAAHRVDGVVTLNAFSSLRAVTPPWARGLLPDRFDNVATVGRLSAPLLLLHGTADDLVPVEEAAKLKAAGGANARLLRLDGAPHHVALDGLAQRIWREIELMPASTGTATHP